MPKPGLGRHFPPEGGKTWRTQSSRDGCRGEGPRESPLNAFGQHGDKSSLTC